MVKKKVTKLSKLPNWAKVGLWVLGILVGLIVLTVIGLKVWVSTWPEYKGDGFTLQFPSGWDVKDPRNDKSDIQYVFDYGSVLKLGDKDTDFSQDSDGLYRYKGHILIYVYKHSINQNVMQKNSFSKTSDGYERIYFYKWGDSVYELTMNIFDRGNKLQNYYYDFLGTTVFFKLKPF